MKGFYLLLLLSFFVSKTLSSDICVGQYDGERLAHPYDCDKFVICRFEKIAETRNCPNGLQFNRRLGVCDLRSRAGCELPLPGFMAAVSAAADAGCDCSTCCACCECGGNTTPTATPPSGCETEPTEGPTQGPTEGPTEAPTQAPTQGPTEAPTQGPTEAPTQGPTEAPTQGPTEAPTQGPTQGPTEAPTQAPTEAPTQGPTASPTPSVPTPTPTDSPSSGCSNDIDKCVGKPAGTQMLYEGDCNRYIACVGDCAYVMNCPDNLYYNITARICDYPENVDCDYPNSGPTGPTTGPSGLSCTRPSVCAKKLEGAILPDTSDKNGYIVCQCECPIPMKCPTGLVFDSEENVCDRADKCQNGLVYNSTSNQCDWPAGTETENGNTQVVCENTSTICKNQDEGKLFPVDGYCNKFYKCNYGCAVEIDCPNNLIYNSKAESCDWPLNTDCKYAYTPPSGPTAGPSGIACPSGGRCVGKKEGEILTSKTSCGNYVVCQCECEVEMPCPKNLYWDTSVQSCNYAANVTCTL